MTVRAVAPSARPARLIAGASEAERLRAARAEIAALRRARAESAVRAEPIVPAPGRVAATAGRPTASREPRPSLAANRHEAARALPSRRGAGLVAAVGLAGLAIGALLGRVTAPEPPCAATVAAAVPAVPGAADVASLERTVVRLEAETEALHRELLRLELAALTPVGADAPADTGSAERDEDGTLVGTEARPTAIDGRPEATDATASGTGSGHDEPDDPADVDDALARAEIELAGLVPGRAGEPPWPHEIEAARQDVHRRLLDTFGIDALIVARHARGDANRLVVSAAGDPHSTLLAGDVLLRIDGERVLDLAELHRYATIASDRADDAGESGESHVLEVLRDGERLVLSYDAPLGTLVLDETSGAPLALE